MSIYFKNTWKPSPYTIILEDEIKLSLESKGFSIQEFIETDEVNKLSLLFRENHSMRSDNGGMFYSIYSQDIKYRRLIHDKINQILKPKIDSFFKDYKIVLNSFVVKISGPKSELNLHQDTTGLDEWKYSPLSLWIPLQDVDEQNGCLGIIPHSQHFFSPYRSISFPTPFDNIHNKVKQYLHPLKMNAGDVLIFDNRVIHHSYPNFSSKTRVALICGLFPEQAKLITCHKPEYKCGGKLELIEHDDDYLLTGKNFLIDCQKRPETGKSLGWVEDPYLEISAEDFEVLCKNYNINKTSDKYFENTECEMIGEPN
jgi:hypothetical protein